VIVAGVEDVAIGETIADLETRAPLPPIRIDEPTVAMTFSVNQCGRGPAAKASSVTSRKLGERIEFEGAPQRQHPRRATFARSVARDGPAANCSSP